MTSCSGCNAPLGWKKYNFQKQWRIPGYFCRGCMEKIGRDFDEHGRVTAPRRCCDACGVELYFLESVWHGKKQRRCCSVCRDAGPAAADGPSVASGLPPVPARVPVMMALFAAFGFVLMMAGFAYVVLVAPQQESGLLHVILGSTMSGAGFMLARKMIRVRNLILGKKGARVEARQ